MLNASVAAIPATNLQKDFMSLLRSESRREAEALTRTANHCRKGP